MKLLTTGGLLYANVQAANADGSNGQYQSLDWVAMFPEQQNYGANAASTSTPIGIGWDPMVVDVISNWDGGKTIAGFGKLTGTIYGSWVIKMWGAKGTNNCGDNSVITGYVTMVVGLTADLGSTSADCSLTANAKVQWAWTNVATDLLTQTTNRYSYVITSATEEYNYGGEAATGAAAGDDSYIIVCGGHTVDSTAAYGLNSWSSVGEFIDFNGVTATTNALNAKVTAAWEMPVVNLAAEVVFFTTASNANALLNGVTATHHCWTAVVGYPVATDTLRAVLGGYTGSITTCLKHAVDGYSFWGANVLAKVGKDWAAAQFTDANANLFVTQTANLTQMASSIGVKTGGRAGLNLAQIRVLHMNYTATTYEVFALLTTSEYYWNSLILSQKVGDNFNAAQGAVQLLTATFGTVWNIWPFTSNNTATGTYYVGQVPDNIICVGMKVGKGSMFRATLAGDPKVYTATSTSTFTVNNDANGVVTIASPTGGMGQFKGATYGTTDMKYVQVLCTGIQPYYFTTWAVSLDSGASNGWIISCYTGIPQCSTNLSDGITALTAAETATCLNDPRYLTWRLFNVKVDINGTVSWWRTDSYWDSSSTMFSSTWGTGIKLSVSPISNDDNNGTTNLGKTFVFAYSDGSGVQLNHIAFGTTPVSTNSTAGAGTNGLTTAPTSFSNTSPNMVNENYCGGSNLELTGTTDTSALVTAITDYSDGYKAKLTVNLEMILPGAAGGWRGVCMVYYSSQYVMDNTNGSICFAAGVSSAVGAGPTDFGAGYLHHVASSTWQPPSKSSTLTVTTGALADTKYSIVYAPAATTKFMYTEGYYASATWYQPKYASSYGTGIARFGKDDYAGAFCMQGAGSTSYFSAPAASVKLTGAMYLAVGAISLGTALSLAI